MMKKLMLGTALSALLVSGALAQTPAPSNPPPASKSDHATTPATNKSDQAKPAAQAGGKADFVATQKPDQWLASKFKGTDVVGSDNKKIGDVSDILFDKNGKIEAYVVSIGGFLGMGAKDVALAPSSFDVVPGSNGSADKLKLSMSKDELKQAQNFKAYEPPHPTTTGSGPAGGGKPLGAAPPAGHTTPPAGR
jgi:sporulation protein YlmC with PRC-barrel domain